MKDAAAAPQARQNRSESGGQTSEEQQAFLLPCFIWVPACFLWVFPYELRWDVTHKWTHWFAHVGIPSLRLLLGGLRPYQIDSVKF